MRFPQALGAPAAGLVVAAILAVSAPEPASSLPIPVSPTNPDVANQWVNPDIRPRDQQSPIRAELEHIDGEELTIKLSNSGLDDLRGVSIRIQRAPAVTGVQPARTALHSDQSTFDVTTPFQPMNVTVAPGQSESVRLRIDTATLQLSPGKIYPLLINVNGQVGQMGESYLTSERFLYQAGAAALGTAGTAAAGSGATSADRQTKDPAESAEDNKDVPMAVILPITAETDILPGGTGEAPNQPQLLLQTDSLASQLGPQGRLTGLLHTASQADSHTCIAVDPELVDTIDRMRGGYRVTNIRPNPTAARPRLRDSWFQSRAGTSSGTAGSGAEAASQWIAQLMEFDRRGGCILTLPWANTDLNAVARTGNHNLANEAVTRGSFTLSRVLGHPVKQDLILPGQGYFDGHTAAALAQVSAVDPEQSFEAPAAPGKWRALLAKNTIGRLSPGVDAVAFDPDLGATLAEMGDSPHTVGYGNQWQRLDYRVDSPVARRLTAQSSVDLAVAQGGPVVVMPSSDLSVDDAAALVATTNRLYSAGRARAVLPQELPTAQTSEASDGSSFQDPAEVTDTEVVRATQQAKSIDDITSLMTNDPAIALSRYNFTNPLRQDLLRSLSVSGRHSLNTYDTATRRADTTLNRNRDMLQSLRTSVALVPPGNVYTRASANAPLLIVAQNGLPLPVDAHLDFSGPEGTSLHGPQTLRIPARGSITSEMTADLPDLEGRTDLEVWLSSPTGAQVSVPVKIGVQTRTGFLGIFAIVAALFAAAGLLVFRQARRRRRRAARL